MGLSRLIDARIELLCARVWLEEDHVEEARAAMERAQPVAEEEGLGLEQMTLWGLEAMLAKHNGEDPAYALEELRELRRAMPPQLPTRAWWPGALPKLLHDPEPT